MAKGNKVIVNIGETIFSSLANIAELRRVPTNDIPQGRNMVLDGDITVGDGGGGVYVWSTTNADPESLPNTIKPNDRGPTEPGRWIKTGSEGSGEGGSGDMDDAQTIAATGADWSGYRNLARKLRQAQFRTANQPPIVIRWAAIGNSNVRNAGGGLSGPNNDPGSVLMRQAKAQLDPNGLANWEIVNYGANGTAYVDFDYPDNLDPLDPSDRRTIRQKLTDYKPDVVVCAYVTNDAALEFFMSGQTRTFVATGVEYINKFCYEHDADIVHLTMPHKHIARSRIPNPGGRSGLMINSTIPWFYPYTSFNKGQQGGDLYTFTVTAGNNRVTQAPGFFALNGVPLDYLGVGKIINIADKLLGASTPNAGNYTISNIAADGSYIELDRKMVIDENLVFQDAGPANLTNETNQLTIRRINADPETEQTPKASQMITMVSPLADGRMVESVQTFLIINSDVRQAVAASHYPCNLLDVEAGYLVGKLKYSEDRWYNGQETVHYNSQFVADVLEPMATNLIASLTANFRSVSNGGTVSYDSGLFVRPDLAPGVPYTDENQLGLIANRRKVDIQLATNQNMVLRTPDGYIIKEVGYVPEIASTTNINRLFISSNSYLKQYEWKQPRFNIAINSPVRFDPGTNGYLMGRVYGYHPAQSTTIYNLSAIRANGVWSVLAPVAVSTTGNTNGYTLTISGNGTAIEFKPIADNTTIIFDLVFTDTDGYGIPSKGA